MVMKTAIILSIAAVVFAACASRDAKTVNSGARSATPAAAPTAVIPKDGSYNAKGVVTKVNVAGATIEIDHEEIVGLMPKMIMEFHLSDKSLLNGIKPGDKVEFVLEYKHPAETVVSIKKIS